MCIQLFERQFLAIRVSVYFVPGTPCLRVNLSATCLIYFPLMIDHTFSHLLKCFALGLVRTDMFCKSVYYGTISTLEFFLLKREFRVESFTDLLFLAGLPLTLGELCWLLPSTFVARHPFPISPFAFALKEMF